METKAAWRSLAGGQLRRRLLLPWGALPPDSTPMVAAGYAEHAPADQRQQSTVPMPLSAPPSRCRHRCGGPHAIRFAVAFPFHGPSPMRTTRQRQILRLHSERLQVLGSVTPCWPWYLPLRSFVAHGAFPSPWKNSTCAQPPPA